MSAPKEGSRDIGDGIIVSVTPDVCKTPVGSSTPPIPYSVFAKQGDDANTAATVRMTGKRAHNMASLVTKTQGDAPGSAGGIKSGTTGAACHPKTHSGNVNIQGKPAIRHTDEWFMNNKNTVGKLTFVKSTETFDHTPAIDLTQNRETELDPGTLAAVNTENSDIVAAILGGMERASAEGLPAGSFQVADASGGLGFASPDPETPPVDIPDSRPDTRPSGQQQPANDNRDPNRVRRPPAQPRAPRPRLPWYEIAREMWAQLGQAITGSFGRTARELDHMSRDPRFPSDLQDYLRGAARTAEANPHIEGDIFDRALDNITRGSVGTPQERDLLTGEPVGESEVEEGEETEAESEVTPENLRITGEGDEEEKEENPCDVRRYGSLKCPGGDDQKHHIVPDSVLRYGNRDEGERGINRIDGMPSFRDGMSICLSGHASDPLSGHGIAHGVTDPLIAEAGENAPIPGTTTLDTAVEAGMLGAISARPECDEEIIAAVEAQFGSINGDRLVNAANAPATGAARDALIAGQ